MAQTGYTPISIYYSSTATNVPTAGNLVAGELAINTADGKLFYKDSSGVVQVIGTKGGVGSSTTTQVLYNSSGLVVGSANMTFSGTALTLANDASISGLTVGKGGGAQSTSTAFGYQALNATNTGSGEVAIGYESLKANTSGNYNIGIGYRTLLVNTTGGSNIAIGNASLTANTTASYNTGVGDSTLSANTTGTGNSGFGQAALYLTTTGSYNTGLGQGALQNNTTASYNTTVGYQAGYSNTTGQGITAVGYGAGRLNTTAGGQTFVGYQAGFNATGSNNTAIGSSAGTSITTGTGNTLIGSQAGQNMTTGVQNTFIGGAWNTNGAGYYVTTGSKNTIIGGYDGNQGGVDIRTSSNNIVLSDGDGNPRGRCDSSANWTFLNNVTVDSYFGLAVAANSAAVFDMSAAINQRIGMRINTSNSPGSGSFISFTNLSGNVAGSITHTGTTTVAYNTSSDYRLKENIAPMTGALAKVQALKPCTYTWKEDGTDGQGFIAHELAEVCPQAVTFEKDAVDDEGNPKYQGVDTSFLVATLAAAIQELKAEFDAYKATHP